TFFMLHPPTGIDSFEFADLTVTEDSAKAKMKVYLLGGQSNMDGRADNDDLPSELQLPQSDVQIYFEGSWYDLQPGLSFLQLGQSFGPEVTFGRELADSYNEKIALIKYARGGTSLAGDWDPVSGSHYNIFLNEVEDALSTLVTQYDVEVAGMIWMQGERDSKFLDMANAYEANLTDFIAAVRVEFSVADMPFVIGQISEAGTWTYGNIVRQAQADVSENVGDTALVITSDLTLNGDGIHYDAPGQMTLGIRFADAMILLEQGCGKWGYAPADFNEDCVVNMEDFALFALNWLSCSIPEGDGCVNYLE
ncbi:MAG: hypothetical protein KAS23_04095, partial [Anaerohalosphaera sp.]|nr:hypothetical protein [Anaerohalosphaera sp.]